MENIILYFIIGSAFIVILAQAFKINSLSREVNAYINHDIHEEAQVQDCLAASSTLRTMRDMVPSTERERRRFVEFCRDVNTFRKYRRIVALNPEFEKKYNAVISEVEDYFSKNTNHE